MSVVERVGEQTRRDARQPVHQKYEELEAERKKLIAEKREIESELGQLAAMKKTELARVYRGRRDTVAGTCEVASRYDTKRYDLLSRKKAVEDRLQQVQSKFSSRPEGTFPPREETVVLLRIESLLLRIVKRLEEST